MPIKDLIKVDLDYKTSCHDSSKSEVFTTKEEYITHLIRTKQIKKNTHKYNDDKIHLIGTLKIDKRVHKGLNWNDVVTTSAIVEDGLISSYEYLPLTVKGVKTNLEIPSLKQYMLHNNIDAEYKNNQYFVNIFRIPTCKNNLDFSSVRAKLALFYGQNIELSKLPHAQNILGLSYRNLTIDCAEPYKVAKDKGCCSEILDLLRPQNPIIAYFSGFAGQNK